MLNKNIILTLALMLFASGSTLLSTSAYAEGFDTQMNLEGQSLYLNGEGPRKKAFITVYDTALYLTEKGTDAQAIIKADHAMSVSLVVRSRFATAERISDAFREGLEQATAGNTKAIEPQIKAFLQVFEQGVVKQDAFNFFYLPGMGTRIYKNDKLMATVAGLPFKQALFSIWLAQELISDKLKSQLLGQ